MPDPGATEQARRIAELIATIRGDRQEARPVGPASSPREEGAVVGAARAIEQLRRHRVRPGRDVSISSIVARTQREAARTQRQLGSVIALWQEMVPTEIATRTTLTAIRGGVLHVRADSAAVSYELDRRLREGLLAALRARHAGTLARVKVTLSR
jgi:predicted nucleic acid-binding Zn ribbon protein